MSSFVKTIDLPKKYLKAGIKSIEVTEYGLGSRLMPNRYWVTIAALVLPSKQCVAFGASACSPEDELDKNHAYNMAIGRARQIAFAVWAGYGGNIVSQPTLFGYADDSLWCPASLTDITLESIRKKANPMFGFAAVHAARMAAEIDRKSRTQIDPDFEWSYRLKEKHWLYNIPVKETIEAAISVINNGEPQVQNVEKEKDSNGNENVPRV